MITEQEKSKIGVDRLENDGAAADPRELEPAICSLTNGQKF